MLSIGREHHISEKPVACVDCGWQGRGAELSAGLMPANAGALYVYAYRCPRCDSFNLSHPGKLLSFPKPLANGEENSAASLTGESSTLAQGEEGIRQ